MTQVHVLTVIVWTHHVLNLQYLTDGTQRHAVTSFITHVINCAVHLLNQCLKLAEQWTLGIRLSISYNRNPIMSNAQMGIGHSSWTFKFRRFRMLRWTGFPPEHSDFEYRWALGIPPEHSDFECSEGQWASPERSDFECSDGHWAGYRSIKFRMLRWAADIQPEHSDFKCLDGRWAFHLGIQILNAQMGIGHSTGAFRFQMLR